MPIEANLSDLLPTALERFDSFGLLWRRERKQFEAGWSVQESLRPYLLDSKLTDEWPGTHVFYGSELYCTYHLCAESLVVLKRATDILELFGPGGPEDLAFFQQGIVKFTSISHEREAWFAT